MSTIFSGTTTGTSGNTTIQVYTLSANTGSTRTATLSVNNGEETGTVSLSQYPKPVMSRSGSGTIPASGGTVSFSVNSAYPFFFRNTPSSVSDITAGGQSYISGNVPAGTYAFDATIGLNPSTASTSDVIEMAFQRFDGAYSYTRPDAASFRVPYQQEGSEEPVVSEINVPVYFDTDGQNVFICLGQSLPFEVRGSVEITYRQGNIELCTFVFSAGESQVLLSDFRGTAIPLSDFDTSLSDYKSITSFLLSNGAPEMTTAYGSDTYYIYCSKVYSSYFIGELETLGNNLDGITWGTEPSVPVPYENQYFTIESLADNNVITISALDDDGKPLQNIWYSLDNGNTWDLFSVNRQVDNTLTINSGDTMLLKGNIEWNLPHIKGSQLINIYGNILSLSYGDDFQNVNTEIHTSYIGMFSDPSRVLNAENLVLPSTSYVSAFREMFYECHTIITAPKIIPSNNGAASKNCCKQMFYRCTSLTTAPELPATTVGESSYEQMFYACSALTETPSVLPADNVSNRAYYRMFAGCSNIERAPEIYASYFGANAAEEMFKNCSNLNYIKCLILKVYNYHSIGNWVYNVQQNGLFIKNPNRTWTTGVNGIPSGWQVQDATE